MFVARPALTDAIQDYLREIYKLGADSARVSVTALAKRQGVSPASASAMVKKLAALGLAVHEPYRGITLTTDLERALDGADFVLIQLRVGGQAARLEDETRPLACGCIGQETTGAGGLAKALRTVPVVLELFDAIVAAHSRRPQRAQVGSRPTLDHVVEV